MVSGNIEFYNVAEIREGVLYRFPKRVCDRLSVPEYDEAGNFKGIYTGHIGSARATYGAELRFVTDARRVAVQFCFSKCARVGAYIGDYLISSEIYPAGAAEIIFERPAAADGVGQEDRLRFGANVWRIVPESDGDIRFDGLQAENGARVRLPERGELPRFTLLAYGSSISQGIGTPYKPLNYLNTAAQILGIDICNKAVSGGCFCEKETIEYLCSEKFDAAYLEAGTNIADRPADVIEERLGNLISSFCERFPQKKIFLMTPVKAFSDVSSTAPLYGENFAKTRRAISAYAAKYPNAVLLDGHLLLDKGYYLTADILHPSDFGHVMMGVRFAQMLAPYLP